MKSFYSKILVAYAILLATLLAGLWFILGQFFSLFDKNVTAALERQYDLFLFIILFIAFFLSLLMATRLLKHYASPIDTVTEVVRKISRHEPFSNHLYLDLNKDDELSSAFINLSRDLHKMSNLRSMEKERLNTLIDSMGSGLIMLGREGTVNLVNGVFRSTFGFTDEKIIGENVNEIGLPVEINKLIEVVFLTEQPKDIQVHLSKDELSSSVSVYGAPVIGKDGNWLGIVVVIHDITELILLEKFRKDFVANVSHELRTPVTSIKGFTETLLDGAMDDSAVAKDFLVIIQKESNRLQLLIEDLLVLSGVEREGFTLQYSKVNIHTVINEALQIVSQVVEEKKMNIVLAFSLDIVIKVDKDRLIQVLVNLLSNAIAYSKEEKTVTISVDVSSDHIIISVQDEGVGIPASELPRLFERFYRVDRDRSRDSGGTGLGLAIVKHLVEAHKGSVLVESQLHVGSVFRVQLPIHQPVVET